MDEMKLTVHVCFFDNFSVDTNVDHKFDKINPQSFINQQAAVTSCVEMESASLRDMFVMVTLIAEMEAM